VTAIIGELYIYIYKHYLKNIYFLITYAYQYTMYESDTNCKKNKPNNSKFQKNSNFISCFPLVFPLIKESEIPGNVKAIRNV